MKFKTGKEAAEYLIKNKGNFNISNQMVLKIIEDEGHRLQFASNANNSTPEWASIVECIVDIESVLLRELSNMEAFMVIRGVYYDPNDRVCGDPNFYNSKFEQWSQTYRAQKYRAALQKFEAALYKHNYLKRV